MTFEQLKAKFPNASESFLRANADRAPRIPAAKPKPVEGESLERTGQGKETSTVGSKKCIISGGKFRITFRVFARRPADWDNYHIKEIQDGLVMSGLLSGDSWNQLHGAIISEKVHSKDQERTEILIEQV